MVLYAHLQQGSLNPSLVKDADVSAGDFLGLVGSSGRSTEPHLHIHAAFGSVIYGPMRPILFREAQFLGKHHAIMPIGESPWIDANGKEIPAMRSLIWPSSEARTGWPRDWPKDTDERERGPTGRGNGRSESCDRWCGSSRGSFRACSGRAGKVMQRRCRRRR